MVDNGQKRSRPTKSAKSKLHLRKFVVNSFMNLLAQTQHHPARIDGVHRFQSSDDVIPCIKCKWRPKGSWTGVPGVPGTGTVAAGGTWNQSESPNRCDGFLAVAPTPYTESV